MFYQMEELVLELNGFSKRKRMEFLEQDWWPKDMTRLLEFLELKVELPIEVNVDNVGAIYLSKSATTSNRTRHIDTRYHFVREYIDDGVLKVVFVKSEDNHADIMTKNFLIRVYNKRSNAIMNGG